MIDLIERQAAIDALRDLDVPIEEFRDRNQGVLDCIGAIMTLPSAEPDLSDYSDKLWENAYERGKTEGYELGQIDTFDYCTKSLRESREKLRRSERKEDGQKS